MGAALLRSMSLGAWGYMLRCRMCIYCHGRAYVPQAARFCHERPVSPLRRHPVCPGVCKRRLLRGRVGARRAARPRRDDMGGRAVTVRWRLAARPAARARRARLAGARAYAAAQRRRGQPVPAHAQQVPALHWRAWGQPRTLQRVELRAPAMHVKGMVSCPVLQTFFHCACQYHQGIS